MAQPKTSAERIDVLHPWLWHWTIEDERLGGFRSDAYAVATPDGTVIFDALPVASEELAKLGEVCAVVMTHRNHQRSCWRLRRELGVPVFAPPGVREIDEEPDAVLDEGQALPGGLRGVRAQGFTGACYVVHERDGGDSVLFCGDLICHDPGGPYRFPVEPEYFDARGGRQDVARLLEIPLGILCAAHADPALSGCHDLLSAAVETAAD